MGIKDLGPFLRKGGKGGVARPKVEAILVPITALSGYRLAIDTSIIVRKMIFRAREKVVKQTDIINQDVDEGLVRRQWLLETLVMIKQFLRYNITPVFVFDGKPSRHKKDTIEDRIAERQQLFEEIRTTRYTLQSNPAFQTKEAVESFRKLCGRDTAPNLEKKLILKQLLSCLGIPWLQCNTEAELLAAGLVINGHAAAVLSTDTDNLAHGCPVLLTKEGKWTTDGNGVRVPSFEAFRLQDILNMTQLSFPSFIDFCIMCECDYNERMYGVGTEKAFELITKCRYIPALPSNLDTRCLNWRNSRWCFSRKPLFSLINTEGSYDGSGNLSLALKEVSMDIRDIFESLNIGDQVDEIVMMLRPVTPGFPGIPDYFGAVIQPEPKWPLLMNGVPIDGCWDEPREEETPVVQPVNQFVWNGLPAYNQGCVSNNCTFSFD